jgi:hypothetical protein
MSHNIRLLAAPLAVLGLLTAGASIGSAQVIVPAPVVTSFYPAPVVPVAPTVACYPPAPVVSYYAPAPVVSYYAPAPVVSYYPPAAVTTTRYGLFGRRAVSRTSFYPPVVVYP